MIFDPFKRASITLGVPMVSFLKLDHFVATNRTVATILIHGGAASVQRIVENGYRVGNTVHFENADYLVMSMPRIDFSCPDNPGAAAVSFDVIPMAAIAAGLVNAPKEAKEKVYVGDVVELPAMFAPKAMRKILTAAPSA